MRMLSIELKKCKRSGVIPLMIFAGILGALYAFANFVIRKESLLSLPLPPMVILLTQLYGVIMVVNLFSVVVATSMIYNMEHSNNAMKKMYMSPIEVTSIYNSKFIIMTILLIICIIIQNTALAWVGVLNLPKGTFEIFTLIKFTAYFFVTSMPVMTFMMMVSSRCRNIWVTLGIGVAGFLSGMTMVMENSKLFILNPFVLIMKPFFSTTVSLDNKIIIISIVESVAFLLIGLYMTKHITYE